MAPPDNYRWLKARTGCEIGDGFRAIQAVNSTGKIVAMVGFDHWTPNSCFMHVAADVPVKSLPRRAFELAFHYAERKQVFGLVPEFNKRSKALAIGLGFKEIARLPDAWADGVALVLYRMRRNECRWIGSRKEWAA